uniref:Uncharacterized protein n=1 Tax=Corethron hystrix TaxID=216773 RepID=A0A7S1BFQ0_9STRA|mmetsp:Transcript_23397/g.53394  ORF Transcript_23397/g.53394 Transcript_23397/m.53394 type:complete len:143 (+) Transcript_23397:231-659(+)
MTSQSEIPVAYAFPVKTSDPDIPVTQVTAVTDVTNDRFPGKNSHNASIVGAPLLIYGTDGKIKSETSFCSKCRDVSHEFFRMILIWNTSTVFKNCICMFNKHSLYYYLLRLPSVYYFLISWKKLLEYRPFLIFNVFINSSFV